MTTPQTPFNITKKIPYSVLTADNIHVDGGGVGVGGGAGVVARVCRLGARHHQPGGAGELVRDHADAAPRAVVDEAAFPVPVDVLGGFRRPRHPAREVDVAAGDHVQLLGA